MSGQQIHFYRSIHSATCVCLVAKDLRELSQLVKVYSKDLKFNLIDTVESFIFAGMTFRGFSSFPLIDIFRGHLKCAE